MGLWLCGRVPDLQAQAAGSNLGPGYFAQRSTHHSVPSGSVNEYKLRLGRQGQVRLIPVGDERVDVQIKLRKPAIPERERYCKLNAAT